MQTKIQNFTEFNDMHNETVKWRLGVIQDNTNCAKTAGTFKYMPVPITPFLCEKPYSTNTNKPFLRQQVMSRRTHA